MTAFPQVAALISQGLSPEEAIESLGFDEERKAQALAVYKPVDPQSFFLKVRALKTRAVETLGEILVHGDPSEQLKASEIALRIEEPEERTAEDDAIIAREKQLQSRLLELDEAHAEEEEIPKFVKNKNLREKIVEIEQEENAILALEGALPKPILDE